jgi:polyisoprenoid-binding protein YceI
MRAVAIAFAIATAFAPVAATAAPSLDPAAAAAGHYVLDPRHTSVTASVLHMGLSHFTMRIKQVQGAYDYAPTDPAATKIGITLDARSLDAGDPAVSKEFAGEFLDADHNPQITFTATGIQMTDPDHGTVTGDLVFHGVSQPVTLQVTYNGFSSSLIGGQRMGFSATTVIKRSDFGSKAWLGDVGDEVKVVIETEFARR